MHSWLLSPAPVGEEALSTAAAGRQLASWMGALQAALDETSKRSATEKVVLELALDMEWEDEWARAFCVLR